MEKVYVGALINKKGNVFPLAIIGFILSLIGSIIELYRIVVSETRNLHWIAEGLQLIGAILIFIFFLYFSIACKCLGESISKKTSYLAALTLGIPLIGIFQEITDSTAVLVLLLINLIAGLIIFVNLAIKFKKNYSGLLEEVGIKMIKLIKIGVIMIVCALLLGILLAVTTSKNVGREFSLALFLIVMAALWIWFLVQTVKLYSLMNDLMVNGYEEYCGRREPVSFTTSDENNEIHKEDNPSAVINANSNGSSGNKSLAILLTSIIVIALIGITLIVFPLGEDTSTDREFYSNSGKGNDYVSSEREYDSYPDVNSNNSKGVYATITLPENRKITLKNDHTIPEWSGDASWDIVDDAIVIFTGEGTSYISIIDGYVYEGNYHDGQCWVEDWDVEAEGLYDVGYIPIPSRGEKLKSIYFNNNDNSSESTMDKSMIIDLITNYYNTGSTSNVMDFFENDGINFFQLKNVDKATVFKQISKSGNRKTRHDPDWSTLNISQLPTGDTRVVFEADYYIFYESRTDIYRLLSEFIFSPRNRIKSINDLQTNKTRSY